MEAKVEYPFSCQKFDKAEFQLIKKEFLILQKKVRECWHQKWLGNISIPSEMLNYQRHKILETYHGNVRKTPDDSAS